MEPFRELLEISLRDKKGLVFYVNGLTINGRVTKTIEQDGIVEVTNQTHGRIVVRLERVDAIAMS